MKIARKSKTFQKDEDSYKPFLWVNEIVSKYQRETTPRDPAEMELLLTNKIKITIEVYEDNTFFNGDLSVETYRDLAKHLQNDND